MLNSTLGFSRVLSRVISPMITVSSLPSLCVYPPHLLNLTEIYSTQALNVVIRMEPTMKYPFNVRSFFTDRETKDIGSGLQLWRGYFQSVRPASGRMLINVDISTGTMYKAGPLLSLCLEYVNRNDPNFLAPSRGFPDRERLRLQRFISGIRVITTHPGPDGTIQQTPRVVKKLSTAGANALNFTMREGGSMSVAEYFFRTQNRQLRFPDVICVEVRRTFLLCGSLTHAYFRWVPER